MNIFYLSRACAAAMAITHLGLAAETGAVTPAREISVFEFLQVKNALTELFPQLQTAAYGSVVTRNGNSSSIQRDNNFVSAVYAGAAVLGAPAAHAQPAVSAPPGPNTIIEFLSAGDSAQTFATMQANGRPFMMVKTFGAGAAEGTVSWTAKVTLPNQTPVPLYAQFVIPPVKLGGATEQNGPAERQVRFRGDLLLNHAPVWHSEALRHTPLTTDLAENTGCTDAAVLTLDNYVTTFGRTIGIPTDAASQLISSPKQTILVYLGMFSSLEPVEVSLVLRLDAKTKNKCCYKDDPQKEGSKRFFCTSTETGLEWDEAITQPVRFWMGPPNVRVNGL